MRSDNHIFKVLKMTLKVRALITELRLYQAWQFKFIGGMTKCITKLTKNLLPDYSKS